MITTAGRAPTIGIRADGLNVCQQKVLAASHCVGTRIRALPPTPTRFSQPQKRQHPLSHSACKGLLSTPSFFDRPAQQDITQHDLDPLALPLRPYHESHTVCVCVCVCVCVWV